MRAYDTQAGIWSTPDVYRGEVHDPASQKPYMWDGNNPYFYSDPSGYCLEDACIVEGIVYAAGAFVATHGAEIVESIAHPGGGMGGSLITDAAHVAKNSEALLSATAVGSALKSDAQHAASSWFRSDAVKSGTQFTLKQGDGTQATLFQVNATVDGKKGVAEFMVDSKGQLTHSRFIPDKAINGKPN